MPCPKCGEMEKERDELADWKQQMLHVWSEIDSQKIATLLGCPWGGSAFKWINDHVPLLVKERDNLRQRGGRVTPEIINAALRKFHLGYYSKDALEKLHQRTQRLCSNSMDTNQHAAQGR